MTCATAARSGLKNNYLSHTDLANLERDLAACQQDPATCDEEALIARYQRLSHQNDIDLINQRGGDWGCINERLATAAVDDGAWDDVKLENWHVFNELSGHIAPGQEVTAHLARVQEGALLHETFEAQYCGGVVRGRGAQCGHARKFRR